MFRLFESIEDRVEEKVEGFHRNHGAVFRHYTNEYAEFNRFMTTVFDGDFSDMCEKETERAEKLADTPERRRRVAYIASGLAFARRQTAALRAFADLAAAGCDMPLTQPSANEIVMEKENLLKTVARAISAEYDRRGYSRMPREGNALTSDAGSEALSLRPWGVIAERAQLLLMSDRYNYLVNGAFEYSGYSWNVSGDGTYAFTTARNRDADDNWMVQCHHRQGISLELSVPPGGRMTVANRRKVSPAWPMTARFRLFARFDGGELPVKAVLGGRESEGIVVCREIPEADRWHEVRFRPVELPAGDHALEIVVSNPGTKPAVVNVDGLDLRLSGAPGR